MNEIVTTIAIGVLGVSGAALWKIVTVATAIGRIVERVDSHEKRLDRLETSDAE